MKFAQNPGWDGKEEPQSPFLDHDDLWFFEDNLDTDFLLSVNKVENQETSESNYNKARMAEQLLFELDQVKEEEEPFQHWLEEKIDLPLFDFSVSPVSAEPLLEKVYIKAQTAPLSPPVVSPVPNTQELLHEFERVCGVVEFNHLTPPQSPPSFTDVKSCSASTVNDLTSFGFSNNLLTLQPTPSYHSVAPVQNIAPLYESVIPLTKNEYYCKPYQYPQTVHMLSVPLDMQGYDLSAVVPSPQPDLVRELAAVDELVRSRSQDLPEDVALAWNGKEDRVPSPQRDYNTGSPSLSDSENNMCVEEYPENNTPSSSEEYRSDYNVQPLSPSSSSSCSYSTSEQDEEWIPEPVKTSRNGGKAVRKRAAKPYARPVEDKKSRKKEQNKNAATRYRQKKKAEIEEILGEERELMDKNDDLKAKCSDVEREIKYLKGLMRDLFKAKGLMQ